MTRSFQAGEAVSTPSTFKGAGCSGNGREWGGKERDGMHTRECRETAAQQESACVGLADVNFWPLLLSGNLKGHLSGVHCSPTEDEAQKAGKQMGYDAASAQGKGVRPTTFCQRQHHCQSHPMAAPPHQLHPARIQSAPLSVLIWRPVTNQWQSV